MPFDPNILRAGDHLLYSKSDLFGWITSVKTWSPAVHIEVYAGMEGSLASRNGQGVNIYPFRLAQLYAVLRPDRTYNYGKGLDWFYHSGVKGRLYGWFDLLRFYNIKIPTNGIICSEFAAMFDNACDYHPFHSTYDVGSIDPGDFLLVNCFEHLWRAGQ